MNETIGHIACAHCQRRADVRRYATGARKLYYVCGDCGIIRPAKDAGQRWIENHAEWVTAVTDAGDPPADPPADDPPADPPKKKRRGLFGGIDL